MSVEKIAKKTSIGGQALIEGIMMIGPDKAAIAVRKPNGEIIIEDRALPKKTLITKIPIVRGTYNLFRQMVIGVKALMFSAEFFELEEDRNNDVNIGSELEKTDEVTVDIGDKTLETKIVFDEKVEETKQVEPIKEDIKEEAKEVKESKFDKLLEKIFGDKLKDVAIYFAVVLGLGLGLGLFILLPNLLASLIGINRSVNGGSFFNNIFEGLLRIIIFFLYLMLASQMKDIKRVWQYHGAEHKAIHCYEAGNDMTIENVRQYTTKHPRCGTSFLFFVMVVSILVFSLVGWHVWYINILLRIVLIPLVVGISYEIIKFVGRYEYKFLNVIKAPGLLFQRFTTKEPDDKMIEVAIAAFNRVKPKEDDDSDKW